MYSTGLQTHSASKGFTFCADVTRPTIKLGEEQKNSKRVSESEREGEREKKKKRESLLVRTHEDKETIAKIKWVFLSLSLHQ